MCLRFVFLLITRIAVWLCLSRREERWKTAEILILRHQLAVLQRRQPRRPKPNWADRALFAALSGVIPKARRQGVSADNAVTSRGLGILVDQATKPVTSSDADFIVSGR